MSENFETLITRRVDFQSERLNKLEHTMGNIETMARRIEQVGNQADKNHNYLFGNGVPGLDERVRLLEIKLDEMNKVVTDWAKAVKWVAGIAGGYVLLEVIKFILSGI